MADSERAVREIPNHILEKFLEELGKEAESAKVVEHLRKVLLEDKNLNEASIRAALLSYGSKS
jgi:hypothetical protein